VKLKLTLRRLVLGLSVPAKRLFTSIGNFIKDVRLQNSVAADSDISLTVVKSLDSDAAAASEVASKGVVRALSDRIAFTDGSEVYFLEDYVVGAPDNQTYTLAQEFFIEFGKNVADSVDIQDVQDIEFSTSKDDQVVVTDEDSLIVGLNKSDGVAVDEQATRFIAKSFSESITVQDQVSKLFNRSFTDQLGATDADLPYFLEDYVEGAPTAQTYTLTGQFVKDFGKFESDDLVSFEELGGEATIGDIPTYLLIKSLSNLTTTSDFAVIDLQRGLADNTAITDEGTLVSQNYVDNGTYFAENYVGESRTI